MIEIADFSTPLPRPSKSSSSSISEDTASSKAESMLTVVDLSEDRKSVNASEPAEPTARLQEEAPSLFGSKSRSKSMPDILEDTGTDKDMCVAEGDLFDIHGYLEEQRVRLENAVGLEKLLKVYRLVETMEDEHREQVDYTDLTHILGVENEALIDDIIQLAVADHFF